MDRGRRIESGGCMSSDKLRKGQLFRRRSDGFIFRVESVSRRSPGAHLQCVDALMIFGWYGLPEIQTNFERVEPSKPKLTKEQRAKVRSMVEDEGCTRAEAMAWVTHFEAAHSEVGS